MLNVWYYVVLGIIIWNKALLAASNLDDVINTEKSNRITEERNYVRLNNELLSAVGGQNNETSLGSSRQKTDILEERFYAEESTKAAIQGAEQEVDYNKKYLSGDWKGWRPWLVRKGIIINSTFATDILGNPIGGQKQGIAHADSWGTDVTADLEKLCGYKGLLFYTSFVVRGGSNLSAEKINNQFQIAQLYGGETWRLNELYLEKALLKNQSHIKLGRLDMGNDFLQSPLFYNFVNNVFNGNPGAIYVNTTFLPYPFATWGIYGDVKIKRVLTKIGVYNANPKVKDNGAHGFNFSFEFKNVLWINEWTYLHNQEPNDDGLPGNYRIGAYYTTGKVAKFLGGFTRGNYGFYILLDQMLYRLGRSGTDQGLTAFASLLFSPSNRNLFPFFLSFGLVYKGLFPKRNQDITSFGLAYGAYSPDLRKAQRLAAQQGIAGPYGNKSQNLETVIELNHRFQIRDWFYVLVDIQYIINPKGFGAIENALVVGTQMGVNF